jgi:hypothetical protein
LAHLIGLCIVTAALKVDFFLDAGSAEDMMTAADAPRKTKALQQRTKVVKTDAGVGSATEHAPQSPLCTHN